MPKLAIILGTRPEIIKLCSIIRICEKKGLDYFIIHTNQHYTPNMDRIFFEALGLPQPRYNLNIGSGSHGKQTARMIEAIEGILIEEKPDIAFIQGDTNTVLAGALAASKLSIKVAHVEAGLRSYDWRMPEEKNRIIADHISDYLFTPTINQKEILLKEGISGKKIHVVGNTVVDAVHQNIRLSEKKDYLSQFGLEKDDYVLVTAHRAENIDDKETFKGFLRSFALIHSSLNTKLFYPIHPRSMKMIEEFGLCLPKGVQLSEPVGYLEFLQLMKHAKVILTDSGGVQEEACILGTPCVTLRLSTERPETVDAGANLVSGTGPDSILKATLKMIDNRNTWENPFGKGDSGEKILNIIYEEPDR